MIINNEFWPEWELKWFKEYIDKEGYAYLGCENWPILFARWLYFCEGKGLTQVLLHAFPQFLLDCGVDFRESKWWNQIINNGAIADSTFIWMKIFPYVDFLINYKGANI